jgi:ribosomal protein S8
MSVNNLLADTIARIKTAQMRRAQKCDVLASKFVANVLNVLQSCGFIHSHNPNPKDNHLITVHLKYDDRRFPIISGIRLCSRGSKRTYIGAGDYIRRSYNKRSTFIVSTSAGVVDLVKMRSLGIGGELLLEVH